MNTILLLARTCIISFIYLYDGSQLLMDSTRFESDVQLPYIHGNMTRQIHIEVIGAPSHERSSEQYVTL